MGDGSAAGARLGWAQPCRSPPPSPRADISFQAFGPPARFRRDNVNLWLGWPGGEGAAGRRVPGRCGGGAGARGGSAPASARSLAASVRGIPFPGRAGEEPAVSPRLQPPGPVPSSPGAREPHSKDEEAVGGGRDTPKNNLPNSLGVLAIRKRRWEAIAVGLGELLWWVTGGSGPDLAREIPRERGIPPWQPASPLPFTAVRGTGGGTRRGLEMLIAQQFSYEICLVPGFAFYNQLACGARSSTSHPQRLAETFPSLVSAFVYLCVLPAVHSNFCNTVRLLYG